MADQGLKTGRPGSDWNHEPARNRRGVAQEDWQTHLQRNRVARHAGRIGSGRVRRKRRTGSLSRQDGLTPGDLLQWSEIRWILEEVAGARAQAEAGDLLFGNIDSFLIWNLTGGTAGRHSRHRRNQRQPHPIDGLEHSAVGPRDCE